MPTHHEGSHPKFKADDRRLARRLVLQALYQWKLSGENISEIERQFSVDNNMAKVDTIYFHEVLHGVPTQLTALENCFTPYLDRKISELNLIERIVITIGSYELLNRLDIPYKVVISESVALTKKFGTVDGYKYVNAVLENVAKDLRKLEFSNKSNK